jgi:hypothetical protein
MELVAAGEGAVMASRLFIASAVVAAAICVSAKARAAFMTGNDLYQQCASSGPVESGQCGGYLEAIADAMEANSLHGATACLPAGVQLGQVRDVAMKYLSANPATRQLPAEVLVGAALFAAFPCR